VGEAEAEGGGRGSLRECAATRLGRQTIAISIAIVPRWALVFYEVFDFYDRILHGGGTFTGINLIDSISFYIL